MKIYYLPGAKKYFFQSMILKESSPISKGGTTVNYRFLQLETFLIRRKLMQVWLLSKIFINSPEKEEVKEE
jgi:hypothetical protein